MMRIAINVTFFITMTVFLGCKDNEHGTVHGSFVVADCGLEDSDLNLEVDYFAATYFENTLTVRLQHSSDAQGFVDGLYIEIRDVAEVAENLGEPIQITLVPSLLEFKENGPSTESGDETGYPTTPYAAPARATLYLNDTCGDAPPGFADGEGTITFSRIYQPDKSSRIQGTFELRFIDPRTWESADTMDYASVLGDFDFVYSDRQPEQPFL
jgi:hypothetical protein